MANTQKYVYSFGGGSAEGRADMKDLLGGKGANLAEMSLIGIPVPPGFTITTEVCARLLRPRHEAPRGGQAAGRGRARADGGGRRQEVRRPGRPAPGQRPLRGGPVDAGHDEHHPQPRPDRRLGRGPGQEDRQSAVRLRRLSPRSSTCSAPRRWTSSTRSSSTSSHALKKERGVKLDTDLNADDLKELVRRYKAVYKKHVKEPFPAGPEGPALEGHHGRLQ